MSRAIFFLLIFGNIAGAQPARDDWKVKPFDLEAHLTHTLADAPLTSIERDQIYRIVDEDVHDSFSDAGREEERKVVMSLLVGSIALARDGSQQILVRGTKDFCSPTGNCSLWILVRKAGQFRLALGTEGQVMIVRSSFARGFHDIAIGLHDSAFVEQYTVYGWDGTGYKQADCYSTEYPADADRPVRPEIVGCR